MIFDVAMKLFMDPGGTGDFQVGEEVVGDEFLAKATANLGSGGVVDSITITDGGSHYKQGTPPSVTISEEEEVVLQRLLQLFLLVLSMVLLLQISSYYSSAPTVTVDYSPKDNRAEVKSWDSATRALQIINRTGTFTTDEVVTGLTSKPSGLQKRSTL